MATTVGGGDGLHVDDPEAVRAGWLRQLNALASQVKAWAEAAGWRTRLVSKPMRDGGLGRFEVPLLLMERLAIQIALNPVSRFVPDADGSVDLYVVPAYDEVAALYLAGDEWTIHYGFDDHRAGSDGDVGELDVLPLSGESLGRVLDAMASHVEQQL